MTRFRYIVLLIPFLLQSCDFFYSTVEYKGKEAEPRMCVMSHMYAGDSDRRTMHVLHSEFFLHANKRSVPVLENALVTLQVNSSAPVAATFVPDSETMPPQGNRYEEPVKYGCYQAGLAFTGNDTVRLHVEHPQYGIADAVQVCPMPQQVTIQVDSVVPKYAEIWCHLHLPAYSGDLTDVLTLDINSTAAFIWIDTTLEVASLYYYSPDETFAVYDNFRTPTGYYAGSNLTFPVSDTGRSIQMVLVGETGTDSLFAQAEELDIQMNLISQTRDDYRYYTSLDRAQTYASARYVSSHYMAAKHYPELPSIRYSGTDLSPEEQYTYDMSQLFDNISEEFDVLGNAENYQVYSNITGTNSQGVQPFGCFSLMNMYSASVNYTMPKSGN